MEQSHTALRDQVRSTAGRAPQSSAGIIDSQTVKTGHQPGVWGYDGAKHMLGRMRIPIYKLKLLPRRWVGERTVGWWSECRRLSKDDEVTLANSAAWLLLAMCHLMVQRLAPPPKKGKKRPSD